MRPQGTTHCLDRTHFTGLFTQVAAILVITVLALGPLGLPSVSAEEALSPEALEIANLLNCPVCQGQSVRDSNSELARQMRQLIQEKLDAGETREEIFRYFVERYGVSVLREPPRQGYLWLLWWGPVVGALVGVLLLVLYLRHRNRAPFQPVADLAPEELERVDRLIRMEGDAR